MNKKKIDAFDRMKPLRENRKFITRGIKDHEALFEVRINPPRDSHTHSIEIRIGAKYMRSANLKAGDRIEFYSHEEDPEIFGIGKIKKGWKLCPYNYESQGFESYKSAIGSFCACSVKFALREEDQIPPLEVGVTYALSETDIMVRANHDIRIIAQINL